MYKAEQLF
jgi:hypothetical protein